MREPGLHPQRRREAARAELSARELPGGRRGLFHPDLLTFGQTVYLAPIVARVMDVAGVLSVEPVRFQRWREPAAGGLELRRLAHGGWRSPGSTTTQVGRSPGT